MRKELQGSEQGAQESPAGSGRRLLGHGTGGDAGVSFRIWMRMERARQEVKKDRRGRLTENEEVVAEAVPEKERRYRIISMIGSLTMRDDELGRGSAVGRRFLTITAGFQKDGTFPGFRQSETRKKMNVLEAVQPPCRGRICLSLCVPAGTVISEKLDFDRGISVGVVCRRRERKAGGRAGDVWTAGLERALLDAYAAHFFYPVRAGKDGKCPIMSRNISYREMRRSGKI